MSSRDLAETSDDNIKYVNLAGHFVEIKDDISHHDVELFCQNDMHVIMIGNPGTGKSTLLNSAADRILFKSGVSQVTGLTTVLQTEQYRRLRVSDTPGLSDIKTKERAAEEICKALRIGGPTKLVFVWTTNSGRVTAEHYATTKVVLEALIRLKIEIHGKYTVIINQVKPKEALAYSKGMPANIIDVSGFSIYDIGKFMMELKTIEPLREIGLPGICEVLYTVPHMECEDNVLLPQKQSGWLRGLLMRAPVLDLPRNNNVSIDYEHINSKIAEMELQLRIANQKYIDWTDEHANYVKKQLKMAKFRERKHAIGYAIVGAVGTAATAAMCVIQ